MTADSESPRRLLENLAGNPIFKHTSLEAARVHVRDAFENVKEHGVATRLMALAHGLSTHKQRTLAYELATRIAYAKGTKPTEQELRVLELLQATFGLSDAEVARLTMEN